MVGVILPVLIVASIETQRIVSIPRVHNVSFGIFRDRYARTSTPVIISGSFEEWAARSWTPEVLKLKCGAEPLLRECDDYDNQVKILNESLRGDSWGSLQDANLTTLGYSTLADLIDAQQRKEMLYLHDQSIDILCPTLLDDLRVPRYFPVNIMHQVPQAIRKRHGCTSNYGAPGHPSIFLGPGGTESGLHADWGSTRFWMMVIKGTKWFRIFNDSDAPFLEPTEAKDTKRTRGYYAFFNAQAFDPDFSSQPDFSRAVVWEANVTAGDIIFIPERWPHAVRNLDDTIAVSYNYVDDYNQPHYEHYLNSNVDKAAEDDADDEDVDNANSAAKNIAALNQAFFPVRLMSSLPDDHSHETWSKFFNSNHPEQQPTWNETAYDLGHGDWLRDGEALDREMQLMKVKSLLLGDQSEKVKDTENGDQNGGDIDDVHDDADDDEIISETTDESDDHESDDDESDANDDVDDDNVNIADEHDINQDEHDNRDKGDRIDGDLIDDDHIDDDHIDEDHIVDHIDDEHGTADADRHVDDKRDVKGLGHTTNNDESDDQQENVDIWRPNEYVEEDEDASVTDDTKGDLGEEAHGEL